MEASRNLGQSVTMDAFTTALREFVYHMEQALAPKLVEKFLPLPPTFLLNCLEEENKSWGGAHTFLAQSGKQDKPSTLTLSQVKVLVSALIKSVAETLNMEDAL